MLFKCLKKCKTLSPKQETCTIRRLCQMFAFVGNVAAIANEFKTDSGEWREGFPGSVPCPANRDSLDENLRANGNYGALRNQSCESKAIELRQKGINIQLNLNSVIGQYGPQVKRQAEKLIDSGEIDFVGSDCHCIEHLKLLEKNLNDPYFRKIGQLLLKNTIL